MLTVYNHDYCGKVRISSAQLGNPQWKNGSFKIIPTEKAWKVIFRLRANPNNIYYESVLSEQTLKRVSTKKRLVIDIFDGAMLQVMELSNKQLEEVGDLLTSIKGGFMLPSQCYRAEIKNEVQASKLVVHKSLPELSEKQKQNLAALTSTENFGQSEEGQEKLNVGYNQAAIYNNPAMFTDVKIKFTHTSDGEILHLHKAVLGSHSEYFKQIFLQEKDALSNPETTLVLEAPAELEHEYQQVVEFLYSGELTVNKFTLVKYMILADFISCKDLMSACSKYLQKHLHVETKDIQLRMYIQEIHNQTFGQPLTVTELTSLSLAVTEPVSVSRMYKVAEVNSLWSIVSDHGACNAAVFWFAAQLSPRIRNEEIKRIPALKSQGFHGPNFGASASQVEKFDMTMDLMYDQMAAILDCDIQPCSEYEMFNFVLNWLDNHTEEHRDALLSKIRYAYMTAEERHDILTDKTNAAAYKRLKNNPTLVQKIMNGSFWHDRLILNMASSKEFEQNVKDIFPEFNNKVYAPKRRRLQSVGQGGATASLGHH